VTFGAGTRGPIPGPSGAVAAATMPTDLVGGSIILFGTFDPKLLQPGILLEKGILAATDISDLSYHTMVDEIVIAQLSSPIV
jgi:hypothetical protein